MTKYFVLDCAPPLDAAHYRLEVGYPANDKRWEAGKIFSTENPREGFQPPSEPIEITVEEDTEFPPRFYAELYWVPVPLLSRRLVVALREAGVRNLQTYETRLIPPPGKDSPGPDHYLAVNIVGLVGAADLSKSKTNPEVKETRVSMDFASLSLNEAKTGDLQMFRLAENISAVLVHENVKQQIDARGFTSLTWFRPEEWAG